MAYLSVERQSEIAAELYKNGTVKVENLARRFGVSEMTVRRDLEKLEKDGVAYRCYGGASLKNTVTSDIGIKERETQNLEAKSKLARYCYDHFLTGNHIIYLDAGSTVLELAKLLISNKKLTVITNDVILASFLSRENFEPIIVGGRVQAGLGCVHGYVAERQLADMRISAAFVSGLAIDSGYDLFATTENKVFFRRTLLENANKTYLLMDSSKFYKPSVFRIHSISLYTAVITDQTLSDEERQVVLHKGIEWVNV